MKPILIFTFDDGMDTDVLAYHLMAKRGLRGTAYINAGRKITTGKYQNQIPQNYPPLDWVKMRWLKSRGWDVQCHSYYHDNMSTYSVQDTINDMDLQNQAFLEQELGEPKHIAYPYGQRNQDVLNVLSSYRLTGRRAGGIESDMASIDDFLNTPLELPSISGDVNNQTEADRIMERIDELESSNQKIMILMLHSIFQTENFSGVGLYQNHFEQILDYAVSKKIDILTMSQAYENITN